MVDLLRQHFTPADLAKAWCLDETTIRRIFLDQPGVLKIGRTVAGRMKRSYVTLRIPEEVARRVYQERSK
ncbi:MAG: hypothetical protein WBY44_34995 [Bryobacteraceae bacterium]